MGPGLSSPSSVSSCTNEVPPACPKSPVGFSHLLSPAFQQEERRLVVNPI